jgi:predicted nucleic-acid-binding Zn-ribbon protein
MRQGTCPKCGCSDVYRGPVGFAAMSAVFDDRSGHAPDSGAAIDFTSYVCGQCGYAERYVADHASLHSLGEQYEKVSLRKSSHVPFVRSNNYYYLPWLLAALVILPLFIVAGVTVATVLGPNANSTFSFVGDPTKRTQDVEEVVPVLVAKTRLPAGTVLKDPERFFEIKEFPKDVAPHRAIGLFEEIKDKRLKRPLAEGQFVTQDFLLTKKVKE